MSKWYDPDHPGEMDKWIREYFKIEVGTTESYLIRNGISEDTPDGFIKRMNMALAWLWPQLTPRTRPLYEEIQTIVQEFQQKTSRFRPFVDGQPLTIAQEPTEVDAAKCEKAMLLFEQAKQLHKVEATLAAQEAFKKAQSVRASKPRKLDESECRRIAKVYWDSKALGSSYGIAKMLAGEYGVSRTTIHATAKKYRQFN